MALSITDSECMVYLKSRVGRIIAGQKFEVVSTNRGDGILSEGVHFLRDGMFGL